MSPIELSWTAKKTSQPGWLLQAELQASRSSISPWGAPPSLLIIPVFCFSRHPSTVLSMFPQIIDLDKSEQQMLDVHTWSSWVNETFGSSERVSEARVGLKKENSGEEDFCPNESGEGLHGDDSRSSHIHLPIMMTQALFIIILLHSI